MKRELAPVRLGRRSGRRSRPRTRGSSRSSRAIESQQLVARPRERARSTADRARELAHLGAVARRARAAARARARAAIVARPGGGVAVLVAADPAPEARTATGAPGSAARGSRRAASGRGVEQALSRRTRGRAGSRRRRAGGRERTSSVCQSAVISSASVASSRRAPQRGQRRVVERGRAGAPSRTCACEHRAPRRLGRVRRQHELERDGVRAARELGGVDARPLEHARTPRRATRAGSAARARSWRRRRSRWCCSAMFASWK